MCGRTRRPPTLSKTMRLVILHLKRVMHGDFGVPARFLAQASAFEFGAGQFFHDFQRARLVIEKIVVSTEEISQAIFLVQPPDVLGNSARAFEAMLPLVVCGNGAILTGEFAAEGQD